ncbi:sialin-like [Melanaphis sacchari]|uniref:sialin-like n=1 Tax=Melanaphis sacchari TaxID=742174 RepID=UPI000DC157E3|nr:sialin-like [Melanaphis sacchari]
MTYQTFLITARGQVMVALMVGVYLVTATRSHSNQMVISATGNRDTYSAMNVVYQVAYLFVQLPTGLFADRLNPVTSLAVILAGLAATSAVSPFALIGLSSWSWTPWSSAIPVLVTGAVYAVNGALAGSWWPFMNVMLSNWAPPDELAYMYSAISTGVPGGIVAGNLFTGFFYSLHGCDFGYSFFIMSGFCVAWSIAWFLTCHHHPADDPGVRPSELERLTTSLQPKARLPVPWTKIATSLPVLSVMVANFGSTVFYTVLIVYMPVYLKYTMQVDIVENGLMSTLPSLGQIAVMYTAGRCASLIQAKDWMNVSTIRKVFSCIGMAAPAVLVSVATVIPNTFIFYSLLVISYSVSGSVFSGFRINQMEIAPNFVAVITAICDVFGSLAMNVTHIAFMVTFGQSTDQVAWNEVCWCLSAILIICLVPFVLFGNSKIQPWNTSKTSAINEPIAI